MKHFNPRVKYGNFYRDCSSYKIDSMSRIPGCMKVFYEGIQDTLDLQHATIIYYKEIKDKYHELECISIMRTQDMFYLYIHTNMSTTCSTCDGGTTTNHKLNYSDNLKHVIEFNFKENEYDDEIKKLLLHEDFEPKNNSKFEKEIRHLLLFGQIWQLTGDNMLIFSPIVNDKETLQKLEILFTFDNINEINNELDIDYEIQIELRKYYKIEKTFVKIEYNNYGDSNHNDYWVPTKYTINNTEIRDKYFSYEGWNLLPEDGVSLIKFTHIYEENILKVEIPILILK